MRTTQLAGLVAAAALVCLFALLLSSPAVVRSTSPPPAVEPFGFVEVDDMNDVPVKDACAYLEALFEVPVRLGINRAGEPLADVWPPLTITVDWKDVKVVGLNSAVKLIADAAGLQARRSGDGWVLEERR